MGKLPTDSQFDPSSPRYGHFSVSARRTHLGPNEPVLGPTDTVSGPHGSKHGQKATQTVPKLILSIKLDNGTFWGPPRRHRGPFLVILGRLGPQKVPPGVRPGHGHSGAWGTLAAGTRAFRVPKAIVCRPNTTPDNVITFFLEFRTPVALGPVKGPVGLACLLLAC